MLPLFALILGLLIGAFWPAAIPSEYWTYLALLILAILDVLMHALSMLMRRMYDVRAVYLSLLANSLLAFALAAIGEQLGLPLYLCPIFAFGVRLFQNFARVQQEFLVRVDRRAMQKASRQAREEMEPGLSSQDQSDFRAMSKVHDAPSAKAYEEASPKAYEEASLKAYEVPSFSETADKPRFSERRVLAGTDLDTERTQGLREQTLRRLRERVQGVQLTRFEETNSSESEDNLRQERGILDETQFRKLQEMERERALPNHYSKTGRLMNTVQWQRSQNRDYYDDDLFERQD